MSDNVKVAVRVRPFNDREKQRNAKLIVEMVGNTTTIKNPADMEAKGRMFTFDYSYWSHDGYRVRDDAYLEPIDEKYADQARVFGDLGTGVLKNAWDGFNCSLFAYGQTGSGKSYSMVGYDENKGIIPVTCEQLFDEIEKKKATDSMEKEAEYQVSISMLEIYNEMVKDLLNTKSFVKGGLKLREHPTKGFYVENLLVSPVRSYADIEGRIAEGTVNRTVAATNMNATSSRAHTVVSINFAQKAKNKAGKSMTKTSVINLVDLAGSERADSTGATGDRLKEGSMINKSLTCLGNCIKALVDKQLGKNTVVPFRDSSLTKLLKNALGGNSKTIMIAALSPAGINYEETLSTLRFADRAKSIKTKAVVNESPTDKLIREMREEIKRLQGELKGAGQGTIIQGISEDQVNEMKKSMELELRKTQDEMENMNQTWEQRLKEQEERSKQMLFEERNKQEARKVTPHFWNLNEDPILTGMIVHFIFTGSSEIGNAEPANIILKGLSVEKHHATVENNANSSIHIVPAGTILINGKPVKEKTELRHNDRVMFGSTHLYVFHHPQDAARQEKEGKVVKKVSFDSAQEEIAKNKGFDMDTKGKSTEEILLQEDLIKILPMLNEVNAMSEEMNKKMKFEIVLLSPQTRGSKDKRTKVMVKAKNMFNGTEFLWDQNKFINRKFLMQEMYQDYIEGGEWDLPQDKDPFWEPPDSNIIVGTAFVYLAGLAYYVEIDDVFAVADIHNVEKCQMKVKAYPCDNQGKELADEYVENPDELVGKRVDFKINIKQILGLARKYEQVWCQYKFHSEDTNKSDEVPAGTVNPTIDYVKHFTIKPATKMFLDDLAEIPVAVQVWVKQKPGVIDPSLADVVTKELMKLDPKAFKYNYNTEQKNASIPRQTKKSEKDMKIDNLSREVERLQEMLNEKSSKQDRNAQAVPIANNGSDGGSDMTLRCIQELVNEAKHDHSLVLSVARVDRILRTGQDLSPSEIRGDKEQIRNATASSSKVCVIS